MSSSRRGVIYKVSLAVTPDAEDAAGALFEDVFQQPPAIETNVVTASTCVSVYLSNNTKSPHWLNQLRKGISRLETFGFEVGALSVRRLRREDWAESWKRHFKPIDLGSKLLLIPSWSCRKARKGQALVVLDPGLSFGTGQHPTTRFCLEQIVAFRQPNQSQTFLDLGTGSGILAIAAAKLGYSSIEAIDIDAEAIRIAKENARRNLLSIPFAQKDLTHLPLCSAHRFSLICANLIYDLLIAERHRILNRLAPGGRLVLAGILRAQFDEVAAAFEREGFKLLRAKTVNEWRSGAFHRGARAT